MNKEFFDRLIERRRNLADSFDDPAATGVWNSIIDKYSEQAHFVYELLQNADDTKATYARFKLYHDRLVFAHDGKRQFTVSNPDTEIEDRTKGCLGDVNAILSIGHSSKNQSNTIGKFGIGFKAVFQYTKTPYIYSHGIRFRIERYIVPVALSDDHSERLDNETLFEFPFNHDKNDADVAFKAISQRLSSLVNPLLFLSNLKEIRFEYDDTTGIYKKDITKEYTFNDTIAERITLIRNINDDTNNKNLWLFSRIDNDSGRYSVGFYLDDDNNLIQADECAYCFFPTKENTGLHFIIHAPFLLTDSRETIKSGDEHNTKMIELLSELAADSLVYLRDIGIQNNYRLLDDNIISIIPTSKPTSFLSFFGEKYRQQLQFTSFYTKIRNAFKEERIIPTADSYTTSDNAFWAQDTKIMSVFNDEALSIMTNTQDAHWAFTSIARDKCTDSEQSFIDDITSAHLDEKAILSEKYITSEFIKSRSVEWLAEFYKWIAENKTRMNKCRTLPIFISTDGEVVPAYNSEGNPILFLPTDDENDYVTISDTLIDNDDIAAFAKEYGIIKPSLKNEIFNKILPQIKEGGNFDSRLYFKKLFDYYCNECSEVEKDDYIQKIKQYSILRYKSCDKDGFFRGLPQNMYFPTEELLKYFFVKPSTKFVDWEGYLDLVGKENEKHLKSFLCELGVFSDVVIKEYNIDVQDNPIYLFYEWSHSTGISRYTESVIDGCCENVFYIKNNLDKERSYNLWRIIVDIIRTKNHGIKDYNTDGLGENLQVRHKYYYRRPQEEENPSIDCIRLKENKWLLDKSGDFVSPSETYVTNLSSEYDTTSLAAKQFISFLGMPYEDPNMSNLTTEQKKAVKAVELLKTEGINVDSLTHEQIKKIKSVLQNQHIRLDNSFEHEENSDSFLSTQKKKYEKGSEKTKQRRTYTPDKDDDFDYDEYSPKTVDYQKKIEKAKEKSEAEIDLIEQMEELQQKALDSKRYTFGWFKALLELEARESNENADNSKEVSISFGKVFPEGASNRTLILRQPSRYIPRFMEELADIPLILEFENETKKLPIEVISVKSYTLRVKLKPNADINDIDFSAVKEARIAAQNPVFLLEELKDKFAKLELNDDYDMQENLCSNIDFVFGPPGTGKTTYLANDIIIPMMKQPERCRVLVLTPTNKAADVIARKIQEMMGDDTSYKNWLVRFGSTNDDDIADLGILKEKSFDLRTLDKSVIITTIDRFPYDFFMPNGKPYYIRDQKYDYIIFDEASMIPLVKIIYPLFLKQPQKFIVAGDPFQIEPVVHLDMWKGENIYTMVRLNSFSAPKTTPHDYDVKLLTTQYRSIPIIGDLFSRMTYDGVLEHNRTADNQMQINFGEQFEIKPMNIIKFPVSKYESIYRAKRLNKTTPYHIYSALFAYEFTIWLSSLINKYNKNKKIRIGVIAAYKAQADMIERLISSAQLPDTISVQTGTIHGFQGDECEIMISVYNPPPSISPKKDMFLNKKNIINVSISRARDYLFVLMPDDDTEKVDNLLLLKKMERIIKESDDYTEYASNSIEQLMFGNSSYLEENSFSTGHQSVNVYGLPEQKYEIRSEDNAIDIQIHKQV